MKRKLLATLVVLFTVLLQTIFAMDQDPYEVSARPSTT